MIDAQNKWWHHLIIAVLTFGGVFLVWFLKVEEMALTQQTINQFSRPVGAVPFILLFLTMLIGPVMKLKPSLFEDLGDFPYSWRAELGIWFAFWAVIHTLFVVYSRDGFLDYLEGISPWALGALIAVVMAVVLAFLSHKKAIKWLTADCWKWLQNHFTYAIWWLTVIHVLDRALLRPGFPSGDLLHWLYLIMVVLIPLLQFIAFVKTVKENRKERNSQD